MNKNAIIWCLLFFTSTVSGQQVIDYMLLGRAYTEAGKAGEAIDVLSSAIEKKPEGLLYLERASAYMLNGDYSAAIKDFNAANEIEEASGEYGLARVYALKGDVATSLYHMELNLKSPFKKSEKEIMLDPSFSLVENRSEWRQFWKKSWYGRDEEIISEIEYYTSSGKTDEAKALLAELQRDYPGNEDNAYSSALIAVAAGNYSEAVRIISGPAGNRNAPGKYLKVLAEAQEASGNHAGASATYTRMIETSSADAGIFLSRADCYRKTGELGKASADVERYLALYPENKKAISMAGRVEMEKGDNIKAMEYFSRNLKLYPNDAQCYVDRANSYFAAKSWNWAAKDYSMSLDLQPDNSDAWLNKGLSNLNLGKTSDACHDFRKAFSLGNKRATELISRNCIR